MKTRALIQGILLTSALAVVPFGCKGTTTTFTTIATITAFPPTITVITYPLAKPPTSGEVVIVMAEDTLMLWPTLIGELNSFGLTRTMRLTP